jgi:peptide chain release factor subunit 1
LADGKLTLTGEMTMPETRPRQVHRERLSSQALARLRSRQPDGHDVLSLYLSFEPSRLPNLRERHAEADSLLSEAEHRREQSEGHSHEQRMAARETIATVRELLADDDELAPQGAHGLAVFCSTAGDVIEVMSLPEPPAPSVSLEQAPLLAPLVEQLAATRWCVLLVSHRAGRILDGDRDALRETAEVLDDVHRHHAQGGWSQARYQRGVEKEAGDHLRATCALLFEHLRSRPFQRLAIGGPKELHRAVEELLHPDLRALLAGSFEVDVERATVEEVRRRLAPLLEAEERRHEQQALALLREGRAPGGHAAFGLDEVLELLDERRVATLLLPEGLAAPGFRCPSCGRLGTEQVPCPLDGAKPVAVEDVLPDAIAAALAQDAEVTFVRHEAEQMAVAALARY